MKLNPTRLLIVAAALGWLVDILFWGKVPGVNFALFTALCLGGGAYLLTSAGQPPHRRAIVLAAVVLFFAAWTFVRAEPMTVLLGYASTLALMAVLAVTYAGADWAQFGLLEYAGRFVGLLRSVILSPIVFWVQERAREPGTRRSKRGRAGWAILRGVLLAAPVLAVFAALLASADPIFGRGLGRLLSLLRLENLPEYLFRLAYMVAVSYALVGVFLHASGRSAASTDAQTPRWSPRFLGWTEATVVIGSVAALFLAFAVVQFQYFFGGRVNIAIDGFTYAEYARRGFGELLAVGFFSALLLWLLSAVTVRETAAERRAFSVLGAAVVILVVVMLYSAYQRLALYEAAYGFTRSRTYAHVFLVWIGLLLVALAALELASREQRFTLAAVLACVGFAGTLAVMNIDAFIVRQNLARASLPVAGHAGTAPSALDAPYFLELSDDAVPTLVAALKAEETPALIRDQVGAALACLRHRRRLDRDRSGGAPWQSFRLSRYWADRALLAVEGSLEPFVVDSADRPVTVLTPLGHAVSCWPRYVD